MFPQFPYVKRSWPYHICPIRRTCASTSANPSFGSVWSRPGSLGLLTHGHGDWSRKDTGPTPQEEYISRFFVVGIGNKHFTFFSCSSWEGIRMTPADAVMFKKVYLLVKQCQEMQNGAMDNLTSSGRIWAPEFTHTRGSGFMCFLVRFHRLMNSFLFYPLLSSLFKFGTRWAIATGVIWKSKRQLYC